MPSFNLSLVWRLYYFMQTLDITFEKNYHTSLEDRFLMEKIIIHKSVDIGEDAQQVLDKAREEAELNHVRNNPKLYPPDSPIVYKKTVASAMDGKKYTIDDSDKLLPLDQQIKSCTSPAVLKAVYEKLVKGKPDLETIYQSKLKELTQ